MKLNYEVISWFHKSLSLRFHKFNVLCRYSAGKPGTSEDDAKSNYDSMDDLSDSEGDGKGGKSTDEVRRQRRMLSNRESARR